MSQFVIPERRIQPKPAASMAAQWEVLQSAVSVLQVRDALFVDRAPGEALRSTLVNLHAALASLPSLNSYESAVEQKLRRAISLGYTE